MSLLSLHLKSQADRRLKRGHAWIYSNEVDTQRSPLRAFTAGQQVQVLNHGGKLLGVAQMSPANLICARLVSRSDAILDETLLTTRIARALLLRESAYDAPYYRLVYGDSDGLPGLVVDRFGDYLVVQIASMGMEQLKEIIVAVLTQQLAPQGILLANEHSARALEGLPLYTQVAMGQVPDEVELVENAARFMAPIAGGQKTGWFYDHRANRAQLQQWVAGQRVLDVFSYIGGWGIQAAVAGAREVVCVDASEKAVAGVNANAALNQVGDKVSAIAGKAIEVMKQLIAAGEQFDVVVLDPPAFIKRRKDQKAGEAAYRHINDLGLKLLAANGLLVSASCSMHLPMESLKDIVRAAASHSGADARFIYQGGQGADHPVHPAIAETDYLKAIFTRVFKEG